MTFLANCCLVATGHEDGALRLWNLEISSSVVLKSPKGGNHVNSISYIIADAPQFGLQRTTIPHLEKYL